LRVSVIIPAYNGEPFLSDAVASIRRQTDQAGAPPPEIIVVDDGSTDGTAALARTLRVNQYIYQPHRGCPAAARNAGVRAARGGLIAFLDQDDLWPEGRLGAQVAALANEPELDVIFGRVQVLRLDETGGQVQWIAEGAPLARPFISAALFRRRAFERVGEFDETLDYFGDDTDWFARARERGIRMHAVDQVALFWRIHAGNISHTRALRDHARGIDRPLVQVVKKALERRAQRGGR
jgi:glycosyltransferase involved in cell wall biosynthesis